jgi:hypothetical protein
MVHPERRGDEPSPVATLSAIEGVAQVLDHEPVERGGDARHSTPVLADCR